MKESLEKAVMAKRIHHQLMPMQLLLEDGFDQNLFDGLKKFGHKTVGTNPLDSFTSMTAISRISGHIEAVFDPRRTGSTEISYEQSDHCAILMNIA